MEFKLQENNLITFYFEKKLDKWLEIRQKSYNFYSKYLHLHSFKKSRGIFMNVFKQMQRNNNNKMNEWTKLAFTKCTIELIYCNVTTAKKICTLLLCFRIIFCFCCCSCCIEKNTNTMYCLHRKKTLMFVGSTKFLQTFWSHLWIQKVLYY